MPSEQATLISTSAAMARIAALTWDISFSSGPRTAATMQNSLAPVAAVAFAAATSSAMSSQTGRTGDANLPDCEQKWQSSGQPPVFTDTMPSTSTSGPHQRIRTACASESASSSRSSGSSRQRRTWPASSPAPPPRTWLRASSRMSSVTWAPCRWACPGGSTGTLAALLPAGAPAAPVQPGHQLVAVPAVARLRPLDRGAVAVEGVPRQQQQRHADVHPQQGGVLGVGEHGFDRLLCLGDLDAVVGGQRLVQRRVALQAAAQPGKALRRQVRGV